MQSNETRGGRRPKAGRPANDRSVTLSVRITQEAMDKLNRLTRNKSEYLDSLILNQNENGKEEENV